MSSTVSDHGGSRLCVALHKGIERRPRAAVLLGVCLIGCLVATMTAVVVLLRSSQPSSKSIAASVAGTPTTSPGTTFIQSPTLIPQPESTTISAQPSLAPTQPLRSSAPSDTPSDTPSSGPTKTLSPSKPPTEFPSGPPTSEPSAYPSQRPTSAPTIWVNATYTPGKLTVEENGLLLSEGLTSRILAQSGQPVVYVSGMESQILFHQLPDAGATFRDPRASNPGGWIYVSNSEVRRDEEADDSNHKKGGVGALTFDRNGNVVDYRMILQNTEANCGGGRTPWGTWISAEEFAHGNLWQCDPTGEREAKRISLGIDGGNFESFAYDLRKLHFFVTEDAEYGPLRRFTPAAANWSDPWSILHGNGTTEYLLLRPGGTYTWTANKELASERTGLLMPNCEGIDVSGHQLFFVSKVLKTMFVLNLDDSTYTKQTTRQGIFDGEPDQLQRIIGDEELLFFTEEGGQDAGVHARNRFGQFYTLLESPVYEDETTGIAFSPDGRHLYIAYQDNGILFDVSRIDGLPFNAKALNVKYHTATTDAE